MAELSQATAEPTATAVETPQDAPVSASTDAMISVNDYRDQLKSGELSKKISDSGMEPAEWIEKYVQTAAPEGAEPEVTPDVEPEPTLAPPEPVAEPEKKPKAEAPTAKELKDLKSFVKALRDEGFNYDTPEKALDGFKNKEQAVNLYREESRKHRSDLAAERAAREAEAARVKALQTELEAIKANMSKKADAPPQPKVAIPELPVLPEDATPEELSKFKQQVGVREEALLKEFQRMTSEQQSRSETKLNELTNSVKSLMSEFDANKQREAAMKKVEEKNKLLENAFAAANDFVTKVPRYKLSEPIEKVHEKYGELVQDISDIQKTVPGFAGYDMLAEYLNGNQIVAAEFAKREINVSEDIQNYLTIAQLEKDALNHNLSVNGRPDLVKALRLREEDQGVRQQEILDARGEGYQQAQEIQQGHTAGARTMPLSVASAPPDAPKAMTVDEVRVRLSEIRQMTDKSKVEAAMKELQPHIKQLTGTPSK